MTEGTFKSFNPLTYKVNNITEFDNDIVIAHRNQDNLAIGSLLQDQPGTRFNVFICVNKAWHAFILCVPCENDDPLQIMQDMPLEDPFSVPDLLLTYIFELRFENEELRMYKIHRNFLLFKDVKDRIKRSYFIGRYDKVHPRALQFAALRASPHRYNVLLNDCVEFAKEFCMCLLSYCSNFTELERQVEERIQQATASGLSVEQLSRRIQSSARIGNTFLGGTDMTTFLGGRAGTPLVVAFVLLYPVIVSVCVAVAVALVMRS